jgi:hypothetical protein
MRYIKVALPLIVAKTTGGKQLQVRLATACHCIKDYAISAPGLRLQCRQAQ